MSSNIGSAFSTLKALPLYYRIGSVALIVVVTVLFIGFARDMKHAAAIFRAKAAEAAEAEANARTTSQAQEAARRRYVEWLSNATSGKDAFVALSVVFSAEGYESKTMVFTADRADSEFCLKTSENEVMKSAGTLGFEKLQCRNRQSGRKWEYAIVH